MAATSMRHAGIDRADIARTMLGVLILLLVGYTAYASHAATSELARITQCQQARNAEFQAALAGQAQATRDGAAAQREFLTTIARPDLDPAGRDRAFAGYLAALDRIDEARAANPLPPADGCRR